MNNFVPYKNLGWDSNIAAYYYDATSITVKFKSGSATIYLYTYASALMPHIEAMKKLADAGQWLHSYIGKNRPQHASKS